MSIAPTTDPTFLLPIFANHLSDFNSYAKEIVDIHVDVKREYYDALHKTYDIVAKYDITYLNAEHEMITKTVFGKTGSPAVVAYLYEVGTYLYHHGFGSETHIRVPKPLFYEDFFQLFIQEKAIGRTLADLLSLTEQDSHASLVSFAATWLAQFHSQAITRHEVAHIPNERQNIGITNIDEMIVKNNITGFTSEDFLHISKKFLELNSAYLKHTDQILIHGDYHLENIFVDKETQAVTVIDFVESRYGDPLFDVASFVRQLHDLFYDTRGSEFVQRMTRIFRDTYFSHVSSTESEALDRLFLHDVSIRMQNVVHYIIENKITPQHTQNIEKAFHGIVQDIAKLDH